MNLTEEQIDRHARRIALEKAYAAIESSAEDSASEAVWLDDQLVNISADDTDLRKIEWLVENYMYECHVSLD